MCISEDGGRDSLGAMYVMKDWDIMNAPLNLSLVLYLLCRGGEEQAFYLKGHAHGGRGVVACWYGDVGTLG